jgi:hypothetical protein
MRAFLAAWIAAAALTTPSASNSQALDNLASRKDFRAFRSASTDPRGRNGDARHMNPGETLTVADIKGAGQISHIWFTIAAASKEHLREMVLRMTWDDAPRPAVECPIGDFFCQGHGQYVEFTSLPVCMNPGRSLNCFWPMPFKKHAVITVTNEGSQPVYALYYNIDYRLERRAPRNLRYFHTQYRTYFPAPVGKDLTICDTKGAGHYVGTFVAVMANSDGWWGEGNDYWFIDGAEKPTIGGTGTEDYFNGSWDWGKAFSTPYHGVPLYDNAEKGGEKRGILNTAYRWHIEDPVPFTRSLLLTLEHGRAGWDRDRKPFTNHYVTVSYYYLDNPNGDGPEIPAAKDRIPALIPLPQETPATTK